AVSWPATVAIWVRAGGVLWCVVGRVGSRRTVAVAGNVGIPGTAGIVGTVGRFRGRSRRAGPVGGSVVRGRVVSRAAPAVRVAAVVRVAAGQPWGGAAVRTRVRGRPVGARRPVPAPSRAPSCTLWPYGSATEGFSGPPR